MIEMMIEMKGEKMKRVLWAVAVCLGLGVHAVIPLPNLEKLPWIGDGRPDFANEADFYGEDPAPEFLAECTLPPREGEVANGTQSAQSIGLYLGLVPTEQVPAAEAGRKV